MKEERNEEKWWEETARALWCEAPPRRKRKSFWQRQQEKQQQLVEELKATLSKKRKEEEQEPPGPLKLNHPEHLWVYVYKSSTGQLMIGIEPHNHNPCRLPGTVIGELVLMNDDAIALADESHLTLIPRPIWPRDEDEDDWDWKREVLT